MHQDHICSSMEDMKCVNKVKVDTSSCLKPCSGLIITTLAKTESRRELETLFPDFENYKKYKKVTEHPLDLDGKYKCPLSLLMTQAESIHIFIANVRYEE